MSISTKIYPGTLTTRFYPHGRRLFKSVQQMTLVRASSRFVIKHSLYHVRFLSFRMQEINNRKEAFSIRYCAVRPVLAGLLERKLRPISPVNHCLKPGIWRMKKGPSASTRGTRFTMMNDHTQRELQALKLTAKFKVPSRSHKNFILFRFIPPTSCTN